MAEADQARELERVLVRETGRRFIAHALEQMPYRLPRELAEHLARLGYPYSDDAIRTWRDGKHPAPSDVIFALARDLNLSIDEWVFARESLAHEVLTLRRRVNGMEKQFTEMLAEHVRSGHHPATEQQAQAEPG